MRLPEAIEVFAHGFTFTRSFTHPYLVAREGPLIVLRDAPRRSGPSRSEEILVHELTAEQSVHAIRAYGPGRYRLCVIHGPESPLEEVRSEFKAHGFRAARQEPFFVRPLTNPPALDMRVRRVNARDEAEAVRRTSGTRQILPEHLGLDDAPLRLYAAYQEEEPVGWVSSVRVGGSAWVSNPHVQQEHRRQGLGRALMTTMLADDARLGVQQSVLLASLAGAKLYPLLGYEQIGTLQVFNPTRAAR